MKSDALQELVCALLDDAGAVDIRVLDVRGMTDITDCMVVAGGTSERHVRALADRVYEGLGRRRIKPIGVEGRQNAEWILLDYGDVVAHIMDGAVRRFYDLERLWDAGLRNPVRRG